MLRRFLRPECRHQRQRRRLLRLHRLGRRLLRNDLRALDDADARQQREVDRQHPDLAMRHRALARQQQRRGSEVLERLDRRPDEHREE